jgi:Pyruvate/2-oxoacid:ferredoxin oxidoreductase gamma subunit
MLALLAKAVAKNPDADGLLLLIQIEIEHKCAFLSWRTIESVVTQHVPAENLEGAHNVVAVPATQWAQELGDIRSANMVMLGALLKRRPAVASMDAVLRVLNDAVSARHRELNDVNRKALAGGYERA